MRESLTVEEGGEEDLEFAFPASLIRPKPYHTQRGCQHHVVGHRRAEFILQVLHRTAAIINGNKVTLALVGVVHLILQKAHVDLRMG